MNLEYGIFDPILSQTLSRGRCPVAGGEGLVSARAPPSSGRLFLLAAAANLFGAEAAAKAALGAGSPSPVAPGLAHTVKSLAKVDRGD